MSDTEVLTPRTPPAQTVAELRNIYIERAKRNNAARAGPGSAPFGASARILGAEWGVGVGLHFELLKWLRWLSLLLVICSVPFLVVVGCSIFTDAVHMYDHTYGVKKYPSTKVHSLTFAAIVDNSIDNGTLQYMNTEIWSTWKGPMQKGIFLIWISLVDAGAMLLFVCGLAALWYHLGRFAKSIDKSTLEAADYTVLVRGLPPDVDALQVGEYFSRFGEIMDVVLVTDRLSATLERCGRAAMLQQRRTMVLDESNVRKTDGHLEVLHRLDEQLAAVATDIQEVAVRHQSVRAAFVTFNSENEVRACISQCPNSWLGSLMQPRLERFHRHKAFWVGKASAPEDYKFEHLALAEWQVAAREVAINFAMLLVVLVCAATITKLNDISNQQSATIKWLSSQLTADTSIAMSLYGNATTFTTSGTGAAKIATDTTSLKAQLARYCSADLPGYCTSRLQADFSDVVQLTYGQSLIWVNVTSRLLFERPVREKLECSMEALRSDATCGLRGCLPCICLGMQAVGATINERGDTGRGTVVQQLCANYINQLDVRSWGIRLSISAVVAFLNAAIKWVLQVLVLHGCHWTHTARERSFALQCFIAMLVNTVVVLLLTNCDSLGELARESSSGSWVRFFVRYGSYSDFTSGWYENVGLSILILMLINVASPLLNLLIDWLFQAAMRFGVLYLKTWPLQADYDVAWARPRFTLAQRVADLLLNASLALLFGTGMPLLYLVLFAYLGVAELADRWALTRLCCGAARYHDALTKLVMGLLPWLAVAHCAFGLWMHTYFRVVVLPADEGVGGSRDMSQLSAAAVRATNAGGLTALQTSSVWQRITQPNGLALLLLCVGIVLWLLVLRHVVWRALSFLGSAPGRFCCTNARHLVRFRLSRDTDQVVHSVPYAEALVGKQLHGAPTYRLAHHPHYVQYFAASGLNRAVGVAALVAAAASGGARRHSYTRVKTIKPRGRLPGGPSAFRILPEPISDSGSVHLSTEALAASISGISAAAVAAEAARQALVAPVQDALAGQPEMDAPRPRRTPRGVSIRSLPLMPLGPDANLPKARVAGDSRKLAAVAAALAAEGGGQGSRRGPPDMQELLRREEEAAQVVTVGAAEGADRDGEGSQERANGVEQQGAGRQAEETGAGSSLGLAGSLQDGSAGSGGRPVATTAAAAAGGIAAAATAVCVVHTSSRLDLSSLVIEVPGSPDPEPSGAEGEPCLGLLPRVLEAQSGCRNNNGAAGLLQTSSGQHQQVDVQECSPAGAQEANPEPEAAAPDVVVNIGDAADGSEGRGGAGASESGVRGSASQGQDEIDQAAVERSADEHV